MDEIRVDILKSETFNVTDIIDQGKILNDALNLHVDDVDDIINIQIVEENGLKRFWIYLK